MKTKVAFRLATFLAAMATILVTTTASIWYFNQPNVPKELLKK
ncbi:cyclic lactone autoinducer peptide [Cohnella terricola]|uniref:Cyclic lactone autoinducer peptide n=1 Tax=Cohnella terricola TaxID=1289167 RepID=A0A559IV73_9BACL|nr:cyclic lactone autoinducer peptide [Cohnella terricola]TVX91534.1 cyclic lactone autoinducer peptide [Cohnella terricola]